MLLMFYVKECFYLFANSSGLLGLTPPTANICVPIALGIVTGVIMHISSI
ncbi:MAG: hypothetical protein ACLU5J_01560 [Christensenellales bacterium]